MFSSMKGSVYNQIFQRNIYGNIYNCPLMGSVVPNYLFETFECTKDDKYLIYNDELRDIPCYQIRFCDVPGYEQLALVAKENGQLLVVDTDKSGDAAICRKYQAHRNCIFDTHWIGQNEAITSSGDSSIRLHDLNRQFVLRNYFGHKESVKALTLRPAQSTREFASCSRDGTILFWDLREKSAAVIQLTNYETPKASIKLAHLPDGVSVNSVKRRKSFCETTAKSVTSVAFANENILISSGASDDKIKLWDIRKIKSDCTTTPIGVIPYPGSSSIGQGYTDLIVNKSGTKLFASCRDNFIYQFPLDSVNYEHSSICYTGHVASSFYIKLDLSPDENYLAIGSSTKCGYIYEVDCVPQRPILLNGHKEEVTVCRWRLNDPTVMMTISDDFTMMVHRMKPGSEYNVFYRHLIQKQQNSRTRNSNTSNELVGISSRCGRFTVTKENQFKATKDIDQHQTLNLKKSIHISEFPRTPSKKTPKITQSILTSPVHPLKLKQYLQFEKQHPKPQIVTIKPLGDKNSPLHRQQKLDRSKSFFLPKATVKRQGEMTNDENLSRTSEHNKENLKRRKTVCQQQPEITQFFPLSNK